MKLVSKLEEFSFTSYNDLKKHRNDKDLTIYGPQGALMLYTAKELREMGEPIPEGWDRSDYALYFEDVNSQYDHYVAIEKIELDDIYALRRIVQ